MRTQPILVATVLAVLLIPSAHAGEFTFELDEDRSQLFVCDPDGLLVVPARLFLGGSVTVSFDDLEPVSSEGQKPIALTTMDIAGIQPVDEMEGFNIEDLRIFSPVELLPGLPSPPSEGAVDGVPEPPLVIVSALRYAIEASVEIVGLPNPNFNIDQLFLEGAGNPSPDLELALAAPDGGPCAPGTTCVITNDPGGPVPSFELITAQCLDLSICGPTDYCLQIAVSDGFGQVWEFLVVWRLRAEGECAADTDGDGQSPSGGPCSPLDCDDANPEVFTGAEEVPGNGVDDNCDGQIDEAPPGCSAVGIAAAPAGASGALLYLIAALGIVAASRRPSE